MNPLTRPTTGLFLPPPLLGLLPYLPGTEAEPTQYLVPGNLGAFTVAAPAAGRGAIVIVVNGDLNVSSGSIVIPPEVTALIFVRGQRRFPQLRHQQRPRQQQSPGAIANLRRGRAAGAAHRAGRRRRHHLRRLLRPALRRAAHGRR
jgi:hypothetical protein